MCTVYVYMYIVHMNTNYGSRCLFTCSLCLCVCLYVHIFIHVCASAANSNFSMNVTGTKIVSTYHLSLTLPFCCKVQYTASIHANLHWLPQKSLCIAPISVIHQWFLYTLCFYWLQRHWKQTTGISHTPSLSISILILSCICSCVLSTEAKNGSNARDVKFVWLSDIFCNDSPYFSNM